LALSSDRDDIATVLVVFLRGEYGRIPEGGTVVDIGANIGAFAVYAARQGAARVYSIEPSRESFDTLNENIRLNGAGGRIQAFRKVLAGQSGETVDFPVRSCSYNSIGDIENTKLEMEPVETTTLADFLESQGVGEVDLLKLDCEGAEKTIVLDSPDSVWSGILRVRMEYHGAYDRQLRERLESLGFRCTLHRHGAGECGNLWFVRQGLRGK
jgi:FkbM family methyltransferase